MMNKRPNTAKTKKTTDMNQSSSYDDEDSKSESDLNFIEVTNESSSSEGG